MDVQPIETAHQGQRVLGIDLASRRWSDIGSASLTMASDISVRTPAIEWPSGDLQASRLAEKIVRCVDEQSISVVSLDGPHAWRSPSADPNRPGVGRLAEYEAKCQGKTGLYGKTFPSTQIRWTQFCIEVFDHLISAGGKLVNDATWTRVPLLERGRFWVHECYPTDVWKRNQLKALPSKSKVGKDRNALKLYARQLCEVFGLTDFSDRAYSHDDLQAVVAALPAASLLGYLGTPVAMGIPAALYLDPATQNSYSTEGLIWSVAAE